MVPGLVKVQSKNIRNTSKMPLPRDESNGNQITLSQI